MRASDIGGDGRRKEERTRSEGEWKRDGIEKKPLAERKNTAM
jgi:hypothetical protein